ncbi:MAG TPA: GNAT family N-acetyltransferase [Kofleriaceae bacterium]|nr:GNAT family N-acetyltransferase [Kofleriaceae bacterium]
MITAVTADDVPEVLELVAASLAEFGLTFGTGSPTDDELRQLPASYALAGGMFWVARKDRALLGTAGVYPVSPGLFELRKMYLRPAARGLGLGTQLLDTAVAWAKAQGGTHLALDTMDSMTRAIAFYERHGFVRDDAQKRASRCTRGYIRAL